MEITMTKRLLIFFLAIFLLAACNGGEQAPGPIASVQEPEPEPTKAVSPEEPPTEKQPTETAVLDSDDIVSASGVQMECTLVSDQPDAPAEFVEIFGVTEDDWVKGSKTAAVTFVEYGDFQ